jgi:hypothetical protein
VGWAHCEEVAVVKRGYLPDAVPLRQDNHGGVNYAQRPVGVFPRQLGDAIPFALDARTRHGGVSGGWSALVRPGDTAGQAFIVPRISGSASG